MWHRASENKFRKYFGGERDVREATGSSKF